MSTQHNLKTSSMLDSIVLSKNKGEGGISLEFEFILNCNFRMKNVDEKEKNMYLDLLQEKFGEELVVTKKDFIIKDGILDNSIQFSIFGKSNVDLVQKKELLTKINENFVNHYIKDEKFTPRIKLSIKTKIDASGLKDRDDYFFSGLMLFGDLLTTNKSKQNNKIAFETAISNEWMNFVFINPKKASMFPDYENIQKIWANSKHTRFIILDAEKPENNVYQVYIDIFKNFNYIHYESEMIEAQGEKLYSTNFHKGFVSLFYNEKKEIEKINCKHYPDKEYLAFQHLNLILKNVATNWIIEKFVNLENRLFNEDIELLDKLLKRTTMADDNLLDSIVKAREARRNGKKRPIRGGKPSRPQNKRPSNNMENQTYNPFANAFNDTTTMAKIAELVSTPPEPHPSLEEKQIEERTEQSREEVVVEQENINPEPELDIPTGDEATETETN